MKITDLKVGDKVVLDTGFTCRGPGFAEVKEDGRGLYFDCAGARHVHLQGTDKVPNPALYAVHHYIDGQIGDDGELVGISLADVVDA